MGCSNPVSSHLNAAKGHLLIIHYSIRIVKSGPPHLFLMIPLVNKRTVSNGNKSIPLYLFVILFDGDRHGTCLLCDYVAQELQKNERIVVQNASFIALVPYWATWPFETLVLPKRHILTHFSNLIP